MSESGSEKESLVSQVVSQAISKSSEQSDKRSANEPENQILQDQMNQMQEICQKLVQDNNSFDPVDFFTTVSEYCSSYDRVLYSSLSTFYFERDNRQGTISSNLEKALQYTQDENHIKEKENASDPQMVENMDKAEMAVLKMWDHINLVSSQMVYLKANMPRDEMTFLLYIY